MSAGSSVHILPKHGPLLTRRAWHCCFLKDSSSFTWSVVTSDASRCEDCNKLGPSKRGRGLGYCDIPCLPLLAMEDAELHVHQPILWAARMSAVLRHFLHVTEIQKNGLTAHLSPCLSMCPARRRSIQQSTYDVYIAFMHTCSRVSCAERKTPQSKCNMTARQTPFRPPTPQGAKSHVQSHGTQKDPISNVYGSLPADGVPWRSE